MPSTFSAAAVRARLGILAIVAALCLVPPLVRATYTVTGASTMRLNRGFSLPPSKSSVTRPDQIAILVPVPDEHAAAERIAPRSRVADESIPSAPPDRAPDPLRGPPTSFLA
jgi:hypothetical protein